jgi:hypothetical protein
MTRALSWRAVATALFVGSSVAWSCSAPLGNTPPRQGDGGLTITEGTTQDWPIPCSIPDGTKLTASLDRRLGTASTTTGEPFTSHVKWAVWTCDRVVIPQGALMRGRVVYVERGERARLALDVVDIDTTFGPKPVPVVIRSVGDYPAEQEERPFRTSVLIATENQADVDLAEGSELVAELSGPITILP